MYNHLYDKFKDWFQDGGNIWFYSDPHFGDKDAFLLRTNSFTYIKEDHIKFDEMQLKNINSVCGKNDTLVILGDIGEILNAKPYIDKLKAGRKILILGNHDKCNSIRYTKNINSSFHANLFDEVYEGMLMISPNIILSHEPLLINFPYAINIYGHTHEIDNNIYNVCAENINYKPVCINRYFEGIKKKTTDIHRENIDRAIERSNFVKSFINITL